MRINSSPTSFFKRALFRVKVSGESMWPRFVSGRGYWASAWIRPRAGSYVVFRNPRGEGVFLKKVVLEELGGFRVAPLVSWGSGSDTFGVVPRGNIIGTLL